MQRTPLPGERVVDSATGREAYCLAVMGGLDAVLVTDSTTGETYTFPLEDAEVIDGGRRTRKPALARYR
jgi:hypothetical protein